MTAPARPRCHCGTPITYTPGKRPRVYCSDRCRMAAKRAIARDLEAQGKAPSAKANKLGKRSTEFSHPSDQQVSAGAPEPAAVKVDPGVRRYQGRKMLNRVSEIDACRGCGQRVLDQDTGVIYALSARGYVVAMGWTRCGKIWFCPQCSAAIRRSRTEELTTAALRWLAAGGTLAVVVLTARHNRTTALDDLSGALWGVPMVRNGTPVLDRSGKPRRTPGAYQRMLTDPAFYGRPDATRKRKDGTTYVREGIEGIRHWIGYAGMARASEVTRSLANGWHPHMNLLAFLGADVDGTPANGEVTDYFDPDAEFLDWWEDWLRGMWTRTLRNADPSYAPTDECAVARCKCGGKGHGVKVHIIKSPDDKALIEYLTKVQDGKSRPDFAGSIEGDVSAARGAAQEIARGDNKTGRRESVTPFQLLYRLYDLEIAGLDPDDAEGYGTAAECRAWWAEFESAMAGRRAIEWTRGLRRHVQMDGDDSEEKDLEYVYDPDIQAALTGGVILTAAAASTVARADAELAIEEIVTSACYDSAADLIEGLGGFRDHVKVATPQELADAQAALLARLTARREERARQQRIVEYELDHDGQADDADDDEGAA